MSGYNSNVGSYRSGSVNVVVLAGGVGGAKLVDGFAQVIPAGKLSAIVNTGDDFRHMGLAICPDLDTVMYTLAGEANPETGWGRRDETWRAIEEVKRLGGPAWFRVGDLDLATHLVRTAMLEEGHTLTESIQHLSRRLGLVHSILPMSDDPAPTMVECDDGLLAFQDWFVKESWQPAVRKIHFPTDVRATREVLWALEKADVVVLAPSNPYVSIDPILNVYPVRAMIADLPDIVVAVSPIVGGDALKGPAAKMMREMDLVPAAQTIADHYDDLIDLFVYDQLDADALDASRANEYVTLCTDTVMRNRADRKRLAKEIVNQVMELMES